MIRTSTIHSSVLEPASHGMDLMIAVLPSEFCDTILRRKVWRGRNGCKSRRGETNADKG